MEYINPLRPDQHPMGGLKPLVLNKKAPHSGGAQSIIGKQLPASHFFKSCADIGQ